MHRRLSLFFVYVLGWIVTATAELAAEPPPLKLNIGPAGVNRYHPGEWGVVAIDVSNPSDRDAEALVSIFVEGHSSQQFARRIWIPANAKQYSWCPILLPPEVANAGQRQGQLNLYARFSAIVDDEEVLIKSEVDQPFHERTLQTTLNQPFSAIISDTGGTGGHEDTSVGDVVSAMRMAEGCSLIVPELTGHFLAPDTLSLQAADQLIIASDRIADDTAALTAVRHWLYDGGRLWIMLDQVDGRLVELLLGDSLDFVIIDRVGLTSVTIQGPELTEDISRDFEEPVELVRLLAHDVEVANTVNGWPAAFWLRVGKGKVLFTTLGPRGWLRLRQADDPKPPPEDGFVPDIVGNKALSDLSVRFLRAGEMSPEVAVDQFEPFLREQIGYQIPGRGPVLAALAVFCGGVLAGGLLLLGKRRLEWIAVAGPLLAVGTSALLVLWGAQSKHTVPSTVALVQVVEVEPGAEDVQVRGLMSLYHQSESSQPIGATRGGVFVPDLSGLGAATKRMIWTDLGDWHWENLTLPDGVRSASFQYQANMGQPVTARATFDRDGLVGTIDAGPFHSVGDAIVATSRRQSLALHVDDNGGLSAGQDDVLPRDQFVVGTLISDQQRRRQSMYVQFMPSVYEQLRPTIEHPPVRDRPVVIAWAGALDMNFSFPEAQRRVGSALLLIPLTLETPPPGTAVTIPSPFVEFRSVAGPGGESLSTAYSNWTGQWQERKTPSTIFVRFQLPKAVWPLDVQRARLLLDIEAPSRKLEIWGYAADQRVDLFSQSGPLGRVEVKIDDASLLKLDSEGGLILAVALNKHPLEESAAVDYEQPGLLWKIRSLQLEVRGTTPTR